MQSYLLDKGIGTLIHYPIPAHRQKAYQYLDYAENSLPATERVAKRILSLPLFPELEDGQVDYVIETIREFCENSGGEKSDKMLLPPNQVPNLR
jgi:dTDP-4-amino-4,6-dideoxygalactose transaminase